MSGSADGGHSLPGGNVATPLYSTDNRLTWTATEPSPASAVTNIQWWLKNAITAGQTATITFDVLIDAGYAGPSILNNSGISIGNNDPFLEDDALTLLTGINSIDVLVFGDDGTGGGSIFNGTQDGGEAGLPNISASLYEDSNGDGMLNSGESLLATDFTGAGGTFSFSNVADGDFIVVVDDEDTDIPTGWGASTDLEVSILDLGKCGGRRNFWFWPAYASDENFGWNFASL